MQHSLLLRNARLPLGRRSGDGRQDALAALAPVDIAIDRGTITAILPSGAISASSSRAVFDCEGCSVLPGLWDHHVHCSQWSMVRRRIDVSAARSGSALVALLLAELAGAQPGTGDGKSSRAHDNELVIAFGYRAALWPEFPTRALLDSVRSAPLLAIGADLHSAVLNSAALSLLGFEGHPDGILIENECFELQRRLQNVDDATLDAWVDDAMAAASARGIVGITDFEMHWGFDDWLRRVERRPPRVKVRIGTYAQDLERAVAHGLRTDDAVPGDRSGLLTVGPMKIISDGSLNTRSAFCADPYPGMNPATYGAMSIEFADLAERMQFAWRSGIASAVHAIGDRANTIVLDAFERSGAHGSLEHAQLLSRSDLPRFAALGVTASVQPQHALDDREVADRYWAGRTDRAYMFRSLVDAGAAVQLGSDAPVAPLDPWIEIGAAVTRAEPGDRPWHPEQALTVGEAILASTNAVARIDVGGAADLVVTASDPFACSSSDLRGMPVVATIVDGAFSFGGQQ